MLIACGETANGSLQQLFSYQKFTLCVWLTVATLELIRKRMCFFYAALDTSCFSRPAVSRFKGKRDVFRARGLFRCRIVRASDLSACDGIILVYHCCDG